ncbi:MAG: hypothetical protein R3E79_28510 [Caldilineaceae bacterium]
MKNLLSLLVALLLLAILVVGSSWFGFKLPTTSAPQEVETISATQQAVATPIPVQHRIADPALKESVRSISKDGNHYIAVTYVVEDETATLPAGQKRVIVTAAINNETDQPVAVAPTQLALILPDGTRYTANSADPQITPALVDTVIEPQGSIYGFATFDVAQEIDSGVLEWCIDGATPCQQAIQSALP